MPAKPAILKLLLMLIIIGVTLLALESILAAAGLPVYYRPPLKMTVEEAPWMTCDELGCRFVQDAMAAACENGEMAGRPCIINRQGFHDAQDFAVGDDFDKRLRILMLGDSFAFGESADIGQSYVETIEANFPEAIVWNTAIPGVGTKQALLSFQTYAPLLQPQITVLGFVMNDFKDNILPLDHWFWMRDGSSTFRYWLDAAHNIMLELDPSAGRYRAYKAAPLSNEIHRLFIATHLGSLALKTLDPLRSGCYADCWVDATSDYLRALRDAAAAQDTALLVLLIPDKQSMQPDSEKWRWPAAVQLMKELKLPWFNLLDVMDADLDYDTADFGDHWNSAGHQKVGRLLSACVKAFQISGDWSNCERAVMP